MKGFWTRDLKRASNATICTDPWQRRTHINRARLFCHYCFSSMCWYWLWLNRWYQSVSTAFDMMTRMEFFHSTSTSLASIFSFALFTSLSFFPGVSFHLIPHFSFSPFCLVSSPHLLLPSPFLSSPLLSHFPSMFSLSPPSLSFLPSYLPASFFSYTSPPDLFLHFFFFSLLPLFYLAFPSLPHLLFLSLLAFPFSFSLPASFLLLIYLHFFFPHSILLSLTVPSYPFFLPFHSQPLFLFFSLSIIIIINIDINLTLKHFCSIIPMFHRPFSSSRSKDSGKINNTFYFFIFLGCKYKNVMQCNSSRLNICTQHQLSAACLYISKQLEVAIASDKWQQLLSVCIPWMTLKCQSCLYNNDRDTDKHWNLQYYNKDMLIK